MCEKWSEIGKKHVKNGHNTFKNVINWRKIDIYIHKRLKIDEIRLIFDFFL
jgi:hypothetical protein